MKKVSIIVPVYNVEKYLEKCLESIINQTYQNIEIMLINDGSIDSSNDICLKYLKIDKRIILINKQNEGLSLARNLGISQSSGEYIMFVDSDDCINERMVEIMMKFALKDMSEIVICGINYILENGEILSTYIPKDYSLREILKYSYSCNKLFIKKIFKDIYFPVDKKFEDLYTIPRIFSKCKNISLVKEPLYYYTQRNGSITKKRDTNAIFDLLEGYIYLDNYFKFTKYNKEFILLKIEFRKEFISKYYSNQSFVFKIKKYKKVERICKELGSWSMIDILIQIFYIFLPRYYIRGIYRHLTK